MSRWCQNIRNHVNSLFRKCILRPLILGDVPKDCTLLVSIDCVMIDISILFVKIWRTSPIHCYAYWLSIRTKHILRSNWKTAHNFVSEIQQNNNQNDGSFENFSRKLYIQSKTSFHRRKRFNSFEWQWRVAETYGAFEINRCINKSRSSTPDSWLFEQNIKCRWILQTKLLLCTWSAKTKKKFIRGSCEKNENKLF